MASKSKILFIGGTRKFIVEAKITLSNPAKSKVLENFKDLGHKFILVCKIPSIL
ncbi:isoflavone reductase-like protein [Pyrus ussuriensis x Pyrus communis]|uniref:Isoflavone reductase-like protein n=1 Tax=Pyrus ussuriensis x Pyrus communis TaxID=2448454 RepID=A0A5N5H417_9ROSA|nr:isoflavone reductase-like protein [Pyrus ussuriensis x Pyrus communis]